MIWYKTWLESRVRFLVAAAVIILAVSWVILDSERAIARFDRRPPITFTQYVSHVYAGQSQLVWAASVLFLGLGGLVRESALGTACYTLSLPVSRRRWLGVRAALGVFESAVLALIPVVVIPVAARIIGHSYPPWEALKFSTLLLTAGIVFFCLGFFFSSLLPGEFSAAAMGGLSVYFVFTAQDYLYRWLPYFRMSNLLGGGDLVNRATGFLDGWPWGGMLKSMAVAAILFWCATEVEARRDF
jgi:ABC-type transport system involved in multi-copper enzyme maturation permease subunit